MKPGDMIKFEFQPTMDAYGTIVWMENNTLHIDFKNPITRAYENIQKQKSDVVKIGTK